MGVREDGLIGKVTAAWQEDLRPNAQHPWENCEAGCLHLGRGRGAEIGASLSGLAKSMHFRFKKDPV